MAILLTPAKPNLRGAWRYWRPVGGGIVELGTVHGQDVALPTHFHEEDQITFVLRGQRHFVIDGQPVSVAPGEGVHIPAGTPHSSLSGPSGVAGINMYTVPRAYAVSDLVAALSDYWRTTGRIDWGELAVIFEQCRSLATAIPRHDAEECWHAANWGTVGQAARLAGMSREGYSRRFSRLHGMPPHTFQLTENLNEARRLLRTGGRIAAVAADTGFADQSHLGRCFRRAFGVTPGRYRSGQYRSESPVTSVL
ncbi:MAG TPA: AraC family transcriptional regulator [Skermanella sp.]|jgi:AraC-like DNA-binding protein|nr:AraC family transcriptional regulator [Skermanella sp.]